MRAPDRLAIGTTAAIGKHRQGAADREQQVALLRRALGPAQIVSDEVLANEIVADFRILPQLRQTEVLFPRAHPSERSLHRCAFAAIEAHDLAHGPVDLDAAARASPGRRVQPVDVLG